MHAFSNLANSESGGGGPLDHLNSDASTKLLAKIEAFASKDMRISTTLIFIHSFIHLDECFTST